MKNKNTFLLLKVPILSPNSLHKTRNQVLKVNLKDQQQNIEAFIPEHAFLSFVYQKNYRDASVLFPCANIKSLRIMISKYISGLHSCHVRFSTVRITVFLENTTQNCRATWFFLISRVLAAEKKWSILLLFLYKRIRCPAASYCILRDLQVCYRRVCRCVISVLTNQVEEEKSANWNTLIKELSSTIIANYKGQWRREFRKHADALGFSIAQDSSSVDFWSQLIKDNLVKENIEPSDSSTTKSTTSSLAYQKQLNKSDAAYMKRIHDKIQNKWVLKSGSCIEDILFEEGQKYSFEHPIHSYIFDVDDDELKSKFTTAELEEIEAASPKLDLTKPLPKALIDILMHLNQKDTFESIDETFQAMKFDRTKQVEEYWCRESVLNYLNLFFKGNKENRFSTEQDLLDQVYGFIKASRRLNDTKTETALGSNASGENRNLKRDIATTSKVERQVSPEHADLVLKYLSSELSCVEIGLVNHGPNGTKEMNEKKLKTPKMMRSFCSRIVDQYKVEPAVIMIVGIIISDYYITAKVMSFKHGSIGLVYTSPRLKMPESIDQIARLLPPVLTLVYNRAQITKETIKHIKKITTSVVLDPLSNSTSHFSFLSSQ